MGTVPTAPIAEIGENECQEIMEWSRHYDDLLWVVTSLLTAANAGLIAIAAEKADKVRPEVGVLGMLLTVATMFFATSFRSIRSRLHDRLRTIRPEYLYLLKGGEKGLQQWPAYIIFFAMVDALWAWMLWSNGVPHSRIWVAFVSSFGAIIVFGYRGRPHSKDIPTK